MTILNGGIQALFGNVFGALYESATIVHVDNGDDGQGGGTPVMSAPKRCKVQVDRCTESMRRAAGYSNDDVRLIILRAGLALAVDTDCRVMIGGTTYDIVSVDVDPASSYWDCRATRRRE